MLTEPKDRLDGLRTYIDGKMRRYTLLFAVNGGPFVVAELLTKQPEHSLGRLTSTHVAMGAIVFTLLMTVDVWLWGEMMRRRFVSDVFTPVGKAILISLSLLVILGWALAVSS